MDFNSHKNKEYLISVNKVLKILVSSCSISHSQYMYFLFLRVMVRSSLHVIHGMIPVSDISSSPYGHEEVVQFLSKEIGLESQLKPITLPTAPTELLKIDKVMSGDNLKFLGGRAELTFLCF